MKKKLFMIQRKCYRNVQRKLLSFWEQHENREITTAYLLKSCSHLNGPVPTQ